MAGRTGARGKVGQKFVRRRKRNCGLACFAMVEIARVRDREIELLFIVEILKIKVKDATGATEHK